MKICAFCLTQLNHRMQQQRCSAYEEGNEGWEGGIRMGNGREERGGREESKDGVTSARASGLHPPMSTIESNVCPFPSSRVPPVPNYNIGEKE